jgi:hypothetical protein
LLAIFLCISGLPALATGTVRIQQNDGSTQVYENVKIKVLDNKKLTITSPNGKDVMTIDRAACSLVDNVMRCLLYAISITRDGATKPLDFDYGTLYANKTDDRQPLTHSSKSLPPKGVLVSLRTKIGTYISVEGTIDAGLQ